ncbi:hypothetical protein TWF481_011254 [Arthrobotrys musiformis]|uniref:F-box domain-containing protein n=1 Tax=Arthrobotrys musiformis TaxID=47236 RepID=A0AAV9VZ82_9PEZI
MQGDPQKQQLAPGQFPFFSLPAELRLLILSFLKQDVVLPQTRAREMVRLSSEDWLNFAKCSRRCYYFIFPLQFRDREVVLGARDYNNDRWGKVWPEPWTVPRVWKVFGDWGFLAPVRECIRSVTIYVKEIGDIIRRPWLLSRFTNLTKLTIRIGAPICLDWNLYVAILQLLEVSMQPVYDNLVHLSLSVGTNDWAPKRLFYGLEIGSLGLDRVFKGREIEIMWQYLEESERKFLGPPIDKEEFTELMATGRIRLPKGLKTFELHTMMEFWHPGLLLPLVDCPSVTTVCLRDVSISRMGWPHRLPATSDHINTRPAPPKLRLENITSLRLDFLAEEWYQNWYSPDILSVYFPNLDSLNLNLTIDSTFPSFFFKDSSLATTPGYFISHKEEWFHGIPDTPCLKRMEIEWIYPDHEPPDPEYPGDLPEHLDPTFGFSSEWTADVVEYLEQRLRRGVWPHLEVIKIIAPLRTWGDSCEAECKISWVGGEGEGEGPRRYVLECTEDLKMDFARTAS